MSAEDDITRLEACRDTLEWLVEDRTRLDLVEPDARRALLIAAGRLSRPDRAEQRRAAKARRRARKKALRAEDERALEGARIRKLRSAPVFATPPALPPMEGPSPEAPSPERARLNEPRKCYVCKTSFDEVHRFYDQMCQACGDENLERRDRVADLSGRVALVTGARVKIGYQAAIKLLRMGATVLVTTRFPRDAGSRYLREEDFDDWGERLHVHGLDLRHTPSVERFCAYVGRELPRLDFILNNACQTVRRPPGFYRHLMDGESAEPDGRGRPLLAQHREVHEGALTRTADSASLSQVPLLPEELGPDAALFPRGKLDADLQQVDLRDRNSWRLRLHEVPTVELLEVQLVNAVAPYVINGRLRELMAKSPERDKHIVNVSAMEGQFYRAFKTDKHPHTNMAKAALNMMTRTSAADYAVDGIHMNSVDTGWVTDEDPVKIAERKVVEHGFHPPLDIVDGAARIVDPIVHGFLTGEHVFGQFLKDYHPIPW